MGSSKCVDYLWLETTWVTHCSEVGKPGVHIISCDGNLWGQCIPCNEGLQPIIGTKASFASLLQKEAVKSLIDNPCLLPMCMRWWVIVVWGGQPRRSGEQERILDTNTTLHWLFNQALDRKVMGHFKTSKTKYLQQPTTIVAKTPGCRTYDCSCLWQVLRDGECAKHVR